MKLGIGMFVFVLFGAINGAWAVPELKITSLSNAARSTMLEVCGEVKDSDASGKAYLVRIEHGDASYQSMTGMDGKFCTVVKRRTFDGQVKADVVAPLSLGSL